MKRNYLIVASVLVLLMVGVGIYCCTRMNNVLSLATHTPSQHTISATSTFSRPQDLPAPQFLEMSEVYNIVFSEPDFTKPIVANGSITLAGKMNIMPKRVENYLRATVTNNNTLQSELVRIDPDKNEGTFSKVIPLRFGPGTYWIRLEAPNDSSDLDDVGFGGVVEFFLINK